MTYPVNGSIPGQNDLISVSQSQIQTNFSNIVSWSAVDHVQYGATNAGTHNQVTFASQPSLVAPANPISYLFTFLDANSVPQLKFLNSQNSTQYSATANNGGTVVMGGIILKWGSYSTTGISPNTVTFSPAFPNNAFVAFIQGVGSSSALYSVSGLTKSALTFITAVPASSSVYWAVIGN